MKQILLPIGLLIVTAHTTLASAQTKAIREMFTPESRLVYEQAGRKHSHATTLFNEGKVEEALTIQLESIAELRSIKMSGDFYLLARCYVSLGHRAEAGVAFQKCFSWDVLQGDLHPKVAEAIGAAADYAIFLAQSNRIADAKLMYYYALREVNSYDDLKQEPYPFVVVFDTTKYAEVWPFTPSRFEAACIMIRVLGVGAGDDYLGWADQASRLAPNWLYPILYRVFTYHDQYREAYIAKARVVATTPDDKALVDRVVGYDRIHMPKAAPSPVAARKRLLILQTSKAELAKSYERLVDPNPLPM